MADIADEIEAVVGCHRGSIEQVRGSRFGVRGGGEEVAEVGGGQGCKGFGREAAEVGESGGGVGDEGRLVALAAVGDGSEEWGVGLDEDAVGGGEGGGLADGFGSGVGEIAGEGEVETGVERAAGVIEGAGKAVHDAAESVGLPMLGEEGE